jgi:hypothetical protein
MTMAAADPVFPATSDFLSGTDTPHKGRLGAEDL